MAFSIKDDEADRLTRELASYTGETLTQAVLVSVRERLARLQAGKPSTLVEELERIGKRNRKRKVLDGRTADEIIGYDERGLPS